MRVNLECTNLKKRDNGGRRFNENRPPHPYSTRGRPAGGLVGGDVPGRRGAQVVGGAGEEGHGIGMVEMAVGAVGGVVTLNMATNGRTELVHAALLLSMLIRLSHLSEITNLDTVLPYEGLVKTPVDMS